MKAAEDEEVCRATNMTADKHVEFAVRLGNAESKATTWSIADPDHVVHQLERAIYRITSIEQMQFQKELCIRLLEVEAWWQVIGVQELWKTLEQCVMHFTHSTMHAVSHISESVRQMCSGYNFTTAISEWLHIGSVKEAD